MKLYYKMRFRPELSDSPPSISDTEGSGKFIKSSNQDLLKSPLGMQINTNLKRCTDDKTKVPSFTESKIKFPSLILLRGLPGSGKSTSARVLEQIGYKHFEADMFFEIDGIYRYDQQLIPTAHGWCKQMTREALFRGEKVVVSNTFTRISEMKPYFDMGVSDIHVIEANGKWKNSHGVPDEVIKKMAARWEVLPITMRTSNFSN